jgi:ectoine hydroxylase-related dioxygenase (phytanoyl-CoA dioxygenase family)
MDMDVFNRDGFALVQNPFDEKTLAHMQASLDFNTNEANGPRKGGRRDVIDDLPHLRDLSERVEILQIMSEVLGEDAFLVRAILFDKTAEANWKVPWHQDVTIAVKERRDTAGYSPWSMKAGITHVQPPTDVLEHMVTIRVHIDPCPASNGALWVIPGSHHHGRLNQNEVGSYVDKKSTVCCEAATGDILVMRPLLLHSSSASIKPARRRVLHFDFANGDLPNGLQWRMRDYSRPTLFHAPLVQ